MTDSMTYLQRLELSRLLWRRPIVTAAVAPASTLSVASFSAQTTCYDTGNKGFFAPVTRSAACIERVRIAIASLTAPRAPHATI